MADEQYRWLDRETTERLLRGESLDTVDPIARDQAERLAEALSALSAAPSPADAELPGEAAALAAFRKARAERADAGTAAAFDPPTAARGRYADEDTDAGLVRIGAHSHCAGGAGRSLRPRGPRWGRPVRLAVSAALAAGALGGVAAAATTGVLPTPFGGGHPAPGASVSAQATPDRTLVPPSPDGRSGAPTPGGSTPGSGDNAAGKAGQDGSTPGQDSSAGADDGQGGAGGRWDRLASACRDLRDGKGLGSDRRRVLEGAAGGASRVWMYCKGVLRSADGHSGDADGGNPGGGQDGGGQGGGGQDGRGGQGGGHGQGGDDEGGHRGGGHAGGGHGSGGHRGGGHEGGGHGGGGHPGKSAVAPQPFGSPLPGKAVTRTAPSHPHPAHGAR
ncbi:hypothetical protein RKE30_04920 [Streptomyces sp. Li-HN-5-11]|uniref:hypothetical protein n=1 Tax=Streptomyces sp. Li-HN-5-11 TaxID=3075432 RepID=UPI0028AAA098|nr:hypothetical protein [Streptomyces sp. Li-HN-5-11]WNM29787.1 hypothetical protein RKE30_04920 [Streptomyces sp. Li-HN-5-11]